MVLTNKSARRWRMPAHNFRVLATRAHPVYTPTIANYLEIIAQLQRRRTSRFLPFDQLAGLRSNRRPNA